MVEYTKEVSLGFQNGAMTIHATDVAADLILDCILQANAIVLGPNDVELKKGSEQMAINGAQLVMLEMRKLEKEVDLIKLKTPLLGPNGEIMQ